MLNIHLFVCKLVHPLFCELSSVERRHLCFIVTMVSNKPSPVTFDVLFRQKKCLLLIHHRHQLYTIVSGSSVQVPPQGTMIHILLLLGLACGCACQSTTGEGHK